jgi:hypothetical protein
MNSMNKYEHSKFLIERFDHYYDSVNNKGAFLLGINTFLLGGVCAGYISLIDKVKIDMYLTALSILTVVPCLISIFLTICAITPYLKDNHLNDDNPSLFFFGGIARHECQYFIEKYERLEEPDILNDSVRQIHSLARGLSSKFSYLKKASAFLKIEFIVLVPLLLYIFIKLK